MFDKPKQGYYPLDRVMVKTIQNVVSINREYVETGIRKQDDFTSTYLPFFRLLNNWRWCNYRQVYPSHDVGVVCENTTILENLKGAEIKGILPAFGINVPRNLGINDPKFGHLSHVIVDVSNRVQIPKGFPLECVEKVPAFLMPELYAFLFVFEYGHSRLFSFPNDQERLTNDSGDLEVRQISEHHPKDHVVPEALKDALGWAINVCILMKSYPQYIIKEPNKIIVNKEPRISDAHYIRIGKEIKFEKPVAWQPYHKSEPSGRHMAMHWRKGHWRRQPHIEYSCVQTEHNLDNDRICRACGRKIFVTQGYLPDQKPYHMVLIPPLLINAEVKDA